VSVVCFIVLIWLDVAYGVDVALSAVCVFEALFILSNANGFCCARFQRDLDFSEQADFFSADDFDRAVDRVVSSQFDVRADHPFAFVVGVGNVWFCNCIHVVIWLVVAVPRGDVINLAETLPIAINIFNYFHFPIFYKGCRACFFAQKGKSSLSSSSNFGSFFGVITDC
jgi:hypothetical protein